MTPSRGEAVEGAMQFDRIGRRQRAVICFFGDTRPMVPMLAASSPSAVQIWRVKAATEVLPLVPVTAAIVAGWRGIEFGRGQRERAARIGNLDQRDAVGQRLVGTALRHDRDRARRQGLRQKASPSALVPGTATNMKPALDGAAVGRQTLDRERVETRFASGVFGQKVTQLHDGAGSPPRPVGQSMSPRKCLPRVLIEERHQFRKRS